MKWYEGGVNRLYLTIVETAKYLDLPAREIERFIREGQIRTIRYEEKVLINRIQFNLFLRERKKYKQEIAEYLQEPIPEDIDIKDED